MRMRERRKQLTPFEVTQGIFDNTLRSVRRFVVDAPGFLPPSITDLRTVLANTSLMTGANYVRSLHEIQLSVGVPQHHLSSVPMSDQIKTAPSATAVTSLVAGGSKKILVNADKMVGSNSTFMAQVLQEELAHASALEIELGPLNDMPLTSDQYFPLSSKDEVMEWIKICRAERGITDTLNPEQIMAHRAGCQLLFEDLSFTPTNHARCMVYSMPPGHQAPEETRASILQALFMAKYFGGTTKGSITDQVLTGLERMRTGGWSQAFNKGYAKQILGFTMLAPVVAGISMTNDPDSKLSGLIKFLHNANFDDLVLSDFAQGNSGVVFDRAILHFAGIS